METFYNADADGLNFGDYTSLDNWLIGEHGNDNTIETMLPQVLEQFGGVEIQYTHVINSYYSFDNANIKDLYFISNLNERSISLNGTLSDADGDLPTLQEFYSIDFSSDNSNQHNTGIGKDQIFFYNDGDMDIEDGVNIVAIYQGGDVWYIQALGGSPIDDIEIKSGQAFSFQAVKTDEREVDGYGNFNFIQEEI